MGARLRIAGVDVEMRMRFGLLDEALQEQSRGDRAGLPASGAVRQSAMSLDGRVVGRQSGIRQTGSRAAPLAVDLRRQRVVVGVEGRQVRPERDPRRAGQRGEVEDQVRLVLIGARERVGEDQAPLGVGVADLDREALAALSTSPGRIAVAEMAFSATGSTPASADRAPPP